MLAWQAIVGSGMSVPQVMYAKRSGERFPCEHCGCGCATAEQCWRNCCCFTPAERLAWAEKNGVEPPAFVVVAARKAEPTKPACPHCAKRLAAKRSPSSANSAVSLLSALRCRGLTHFWESLVLGSEVRGEPRDFRPLPTGWACLPPSVEHPIGRPDPPTPPPRCV